MCVCVCARACVSCFKKNASLFDNSYLNDFYFFVGLKTLVLGNPICEDGFQGYFLSELVEPWVTKIFICMKEGTVWGLYYINICVCVCVCVCRAHVGRDWWVYPLQTHAHTHPHIHTHTHTHIYIYIYIYIYILYIYIYIYITPCKIIELAHSKDVYLFFFSCK